MMNKKMFVFDLDGTLLTRNDTISPKTFLVLKKAKSKGHVLVVASGRPLIFIKEIVHIEIFDYLICNNGAYYLNQNKNKINGSSFVPKYIINKMIDISIKNKVILFLHSATNCIILGSTENVEIKNVIKNHWVHIKKVDFNDISKFIDLNYVTQSTILFTFKRLQDFKKELLKYENKVEIKIINNHYLDINPKNISKYSAILKISKKNKILNKNIISFGDAKNDFEMIKKSGVGIAMDNAIDKLKGVAV